ncbi:MAG: IclR family transcriptional regulator [Candidatus Velthaea sp.]
MAEVLGTVQRALRVLDYLAQSTSPVAIKQIAGALDLNISSAYHLLNTLVVEGYAARDLAGAFGLGAKAARLGEAYSRAWPVLPLIRAIIHELGARLDESAYLAVVQGRDVVIADIVESQQRVRVAGLARGYGENLHARALGKAVLAHWDADSVRAHFAAHAPQRCTDRTVTELVAIEAELELVRRRGYSEDLEEYCEGVCCIGAPIFTAGGGVYGSLSVSIPAFRFRNARSAARDAVISAAHAASTALGAEIRRTNVG